MENSNSILGGGLDVQSIVAQILYAERAPARRLEAQRSQLQATDSAYADLASKLSDLSSKLSGLISGNFAAKTAVSSNPNIFTASATPAAQTGLYTVKVNSLASAGTYASNAFTNSTQALGLSGTFTLTLSGGPTTISVATGDALSDIQAKINNSGAAVTASIITDSNGSRLSIISNSTGAANDVNVTANTVSGLTLTKMNTGADASLLVNNIPVSSASNSVSSVIQGVTLNLVGADANNTYFLNVNADLTSIKKSLNDFASSYNALISFANQQFKFDSSKNTSGILAGDPTLRQIVSDLQSKINGTFSGNSTYQSFASIGLELQQDGSLTINDANLTAALTSKPTEVQNLFAAPGSVGQALNDSVTNANNPTSGFVAVARNGLQSLMSDITQRVLDIDQRLSFRQKALVDQFTRADQALRNLAMMQNQLSQQLRGL